MLGLMLVLEQNFISSPDTWKTYLNNNKNTFAIHAK